MENIQTRGEVHSLFLPYRGHSEDLLILADRPSEILEIDPPIYLTINGYKVIENLIRNPLKNGETLLKRQEEIGRFSNIEDLRLREILESNSIIKRLFGVNLSEDMSMDDFIRYIKSMSYFLGNEKNSIEAAFLGTTFHQVKEAGELIPGQIRAIREIGGEFFSGLAQELEENTGKINKFPIAKVLELLSKIGKVHKMKEKFWRHRHEKRIENTLYSLYGELRLVYRGFMEDIGKFNSIYQVVDVLAILAIWIRREFIMPTKISAGTEKGRNIRDGRHLLSHNLEDFDKFITNDIPKDQTPIEIYCGANGGGKSTWIKTRLSLQLFHQAFGYAPGDDVELPIRRKIVFMNRGGSGYSENLSAFGSDIHKLKRFIADVYDDSLIMMDEFGSTIPEHEGYALSRALLEYFRDSGAKTLFSTHNEELLRAIEGGEIPGTSYFHVPAKIEGSGKISYTRKLKRGVDIAHTLEVFEAEGFSREILSEARIAQAEGLKLKVKQALQIVPYSISIYTPEERERLKQERRKAFAGLSRHNEVLWQDNDHRSEFVFRYDRQKEYQNPNESVISSNSDRGIETLGEKRDTSTTLEVRHSGGENIPTLHHLYEKHYHGLNLWEDTLKGILKYGITNDPKELQERQRFFDALGEVGFQLFDDHYKRINHFTWVAYLTHPDTNHGWGGKRFDFDYTLLKSFNVELWHEMLRRVESVENMVYHPEYIVEDLLTLMDIEKILGNLPDGFEVEIKPLSDRLQRFVVLLQKHKRAEGRSYEWKYPFSSPIAKIIALQTSRMINTEYANLIGDFRNTVAYVYEIIHGSREKSVSIFDLQEKARTAIGEKLYAGCLFSCESDYNNNKRKEETTAENGTKGMVQVITAMRGSGNLMKPIYDKLQSLDSVHAHQIANYLKDNTIIPTVEEFMKQIKRKTEGKEKKKRKWGEKIVIENNFRTPGFEPGSISALFEFLGIAYAAEMIKKQEWIPVRYNDTGDIDISGAWHPGKKKLSKDRQVKNDFSLKANQNFDILEGATMGGKTMHLQSVSWIIHLAHTLGYVPAKSASLPLFDGIIYIDRILEDEKKKLSAGQNDAKYWKELIENIKGRISSESVNGRYWWGIDEMISSVPPRYQGGLVIAILETLKSLGQKGQISIHNPEFVSKILNMDSVHYTVHHPEMIIRSDGSVDSTHHIVPGRSLDDSGHFSAFSIETAKTMGVPNFITDQAKKYR